MIDPKAISNIKRNSRIFKIATYVANYNYDATNMPHLFKTHKHSKLLMKNVRNVALEAGVPTSITELLKHQSKHGLS